MASKAPPSSTSHCNLVRAPTTQRSTVATVLGQAQARGTVVPTNTAPALEDGQLREAPCWYRSVSSRSLEAAHCRYQSDRAPGGRCKFVLWPVHCSSHQRARANSRRDVGRGSDPIASTATCHPRLLSHVSSFLLLLASHALPSPTRRACQGTCAMAWRGQAHSTSGACPDTEPDIHAPGSPA
ncbi:hypothetical protein M440DRAFT_1453447 [Trichoderma longibrachiatum ATCC 18648]|uniref:Uncharacterized protein n=1 Tax=Trichoderma longibrachiatum ATCC 18648 TaxID=983965 RepID=A0A2T4CDR7_TRILO|nr:hypothetical protein M440DRAFT_1453447 [Trichoderma longibrachiatum ATCC 18648]